jgi:hypothetical protein
MALVLAAVAAACTTRTEAENAGATVPRLIEETTQPSDPETADGNEPVVSSGEEATPPRATTSTTATTTTVGTASGTEAGTQGSDTSPAGEPEPIEVEVDESELDALLEELDDALAQLLAEMNQSEGEIEG